MAKYSLGTAKTAMHANVKKDELYLDPDKANFLEAQMEQQFKAIATSLKNIQNLMNKAVSGKVVRGSYADAFRGWAKKCGSQSIAATNKANSLKAKYTEDIKNFTIKMLDARVSELEAKIAKMLDD